MSTAPPPEPCPFLEIDRPACDRTYADGLGSKYDTFQLVYCVVTALLSAPTFYYTQKLVRARGFFKGILSDSQRRIFLLSSFVCLTLIVRCVDPAGWSKRLPIVVAGMALDLATAAVFSLVINLVDDWTQLTLRVTGRKHLLVGVRRLFYALHAYVWTLLLVTSVLQNTQNKIWLWRGVKLLILALLLLLLSITLAVVGTMIWRFLRRNEQKMGSRNNSTSNLRKGSGADEIPAGDGAMAQGSSSRSLRGSVAIRKSSRASIASSSAKKKRSKVDRILKLLVPMLVLAVLTLLLQLATAQTLFDERFTRERPDDPPTSATDIWVEASFEVVQVLATLVAVYFFRPRRHRNQDSETSNMGGGSRSGRSGSRGAAGRPRQNTNTTTMSDVELGNNGGGAAGTTTTSGNARA